VQAFSQWVRPGGTLGRIVTEARERSTELARRERELRAAALRGSTVAVIAEVKRRSPSKGSINPGIETGEQAAAYARGGASALSILTEPLHFGGAPEDLSRARASVSIPLLRKDFHVHPAQLYEARALGASAALLIARALAPDELEELSGVATSIGLEAFVEVRDEAELERALRTRAPVVGVNNRNLETLEIDPATSDRLLPLVPPERVAVWESGISTAADVRRAAAAGADAVLVGSSVSASQSPVDAVRALVGVPRVRARRHGA
jgi:indole-3-glycerol phosphate synthase